MRGDRSINQDQAAIVRRIFNDYARNKSPRAIASQLNSERVPSPSGKTWSQSTINGNRRRGTGILNNELYIGRLVWNRQRFIKDPDTGRRVTRLNDESELIAQEVPELRIVPQDLWDKAKARQKDLDERKPGLWRRNRPRYLLSGLIKCGECDGGYSKINTTHYGCSASRNKGDSVCANRKTIARVYLEDAVLRALQTHLMRDDLVETFCQEYAQHLNELRTAQHKAQRAKEAELRRLKKRQEQVIQSIYNGVDARMIKDESKYIADRLEELEAEESQQQEQPPPKPLVHPAMANRYREEVENLKEALNRKNARAEASEHLRGLIGKIVLTPESGRDELRIDLHGDLAGILQIASQKRVRPGNETISGPNKIALVAGAGFEPATFGL